MQYQLVYNERGERLWLPLLAGVALTAPFWARPRYPYGMPMPYPYPYPIYYPYPTYYPRPYRSKSEELIFGPIVNC